MSPKKNNLLLTQIKKKKKEPSTSSNTRKAIPKAVRDMTWDFYVGTDNGRSKCFCCNNHVISQNNFECGHVIADKKGGEANVKNLRPVCSLCNKSMQTTNMIKFIKSSGYQLVPNFYGRPEMLKSHYPNGYYRCLECGNIQHGTYSWVGSWLWSEVCKLCKKKTMEFHRT